VAKAKRVFELAKELGVASKAIVSKCDAEGVPNITNHMSTVSFGLAETINQWFSTAESEGGGTAVETAQKVDLDKAKKARRKRAKAVEPDKDAVTADSGDAPKAAARRRTRRAATPKSELADQIAKPAKAKAKAKPKAKKPAAKEQDSDTDASASATASGTSAKRSSRRKPVEPKPGADGDAATSTKTPQDKSSRAKKTTVVEADAADSTGTKPSSDSDETGSTSIAAAVVKPSSPANVVAPSAGPVGKPNVPDRPDVVVPAGTLLGKPAETKLKGPKVIRVEKPDVIKPRKPRQGGGGGGQGGDDPRVADGVVPGIARSRGPARGRGAGGAGVPGAGGGGGGAGDRKRRSNTSRRGRSGEATPAGSKKLSEADYLEQQRRLNQSTGLIKRRRYQERQRSGGQHAASAVEVGGKVEIREPITIKSLSAATGMKGAEIVMSLFAQGVMATINSSISTEMAVELSMEHDIELVVQEQETAEQSVLKEFEERDEVDVRARPPIVTVLGHVDHGKTSLLDRIRKADVASHEAGGITQHVGAYRVTIDGSDGKDKTVVFLDTPGHEAFTTMRARGAKMTDLIVLVVAADDGVMPQTIESINHAKAAEVPVIVALNKIDRPEANEDNIRKIYGQLAEHGLNPTEWGGETEIVKVSAIEGTGITDLLEILDYQAALLELKADFGGAARGTVVEAEMQEGRGPVARVVVQDGRIKVTDFIVIGRAFGRVRDMTDDKGNTTREAGPATPLEISGIDKVPDAGDHFYVTGSLQKAQQVAQQVRETERHLQLVQGSKVTLENIADQINAGDMKELLVVLKGDVQGSVETIRTSLEKLGNSEVGVRVLHSGVGGVTESDVLLADASDAIVIAFHVSVPSAVRDIAEQHSVDVRQYKIIYEVTEEVTKALEGMLESDLKEELFGEAEVKEIFKIGKLGMVAGCIVAEGVIKRDAEIRVEREGVVVTDRRQLESLKRHKDDAKEVQIGTECGIRLKGFDDIKPGDRLVCFKTTEVQRTLD
jgi:translation initiation factor IF-2